MLCMSMLKSSTIVGHIVITKCHLKIIPLTFGAIFSTINGQRALVLATVAPKLHKYGSHKTRKLQYIV